MPKKGTSQNGSTHLDEAMAELARGLAELRQSTASLHRSTEALNQSTAVLNQSMAAMNQNQISFLARLTETDKEMADLKRQSDEKYAAIIRVLAEHSRILERLPVAIREKIGFKPQSLLALDFCRFTG